MVSIGLDTLSQISNRGEERWSVPVIYKLRGSCVIYNIVSASVCDVCKEENNWNA